MTNVGVQPLLIPYILTLSPQEDAIFEEMTDKMRALNFDIEPFGMGSYKVAGIPLLLTGMDIDAFFSDLTANMREFEHLTDFAPVRDRIAKRACRSAVKAGDPLSLAEIQKLLTAMHQTTLRCPHGRPIIVKYRKADVEKWFKRIV